MMTAFAVTAAVVVGALLAYLWRTRDRVTRYHDIRTDSPPPNRGGS